MEIGSAIVGIAIGVGGMVVKEKFFGTKSNDYEQSAISEANILSDENEKLRKKIKEAESQIEELALENQKLRRQYKEKEEACDDFEDELDKTKAEIRKLRFQNDEFLQKINELKLVCQSYEKRINELNKKL